ncbi:unnamed protein product, partial [Discosporangium mesarthrocarpum]
MMLALIRPTNHKQLTTKQLLVAVVGMPALGKTFLVRTIARNLDWMGLRSRTFGVGEHRRKSVGLWQPHNFFSLGACMPYHKHVMMYSTVYAVYTALYRSTLCAACRVCSVGVIVLGPMNCVMCALCVMFVRPCFLSLSSVPS